MESQSPTMQKASPQWLPTPHRVPVVVQQLGTQAQLSADVGGGASPGSENDLDRIDDNGQQMKGLSRSGSSRRLLAHSSTHKKSSLEIVNSSQQSWRSSVDKDSDCRSADVFKTNENWKLWFKVQLRPRDRALAVDVFQARRFPSANNAFRKVFEL